MSGSGLPPQPRQLVLSHLGNSAAPQTRMAAGSQHAQPRQLAPSMLGRSALGQKEAAEDAVYAPGDPRTALHLSLDSSSTSQV